MSLIVVAALLGELAQLVKHLGRPHGLLVLRGLAANDHQQSAIGAFRPVELALM